MSTPGPLGRAVPGPCKGRRTRLPGMACTMPSPVPTLWSGKFPVRMERFIPERGRYGEVAAVNDGSSGGREESYPRGLLDRAADAEFAHARLERRALHAKNNGSAFGTSDAPLGLAESAQNVLALGVLERGNRGRRG